MFTGKSYYTPLISLIILWVGHFFVDFMLGIWPVYKTIVELDLAKAGLIAASCAFLGEGMQIFYGSWGDRGFRKILILFGVLFTAANAFLGTTQNYMLLFLLFLFTCLGSGAFHPSAAALVGGLTEKRKNLFMALFASGGACGMAVSQLAFSNLYGVLDVRIFYIAIPSVLLAGLCAAFGYLKREKTAHSDSKEKYGLKKFKEFFSNKDLRALYINQVCNQTITWGAIFLLPDVLITRGYDEVIAYGGGHLAFILGGALMMVPSGYLADKYSSKKVMTYATLLGLLFFYAFLFIPEISSGMLLTLLCFTGAALGVVQPVALALGNQLCRNNPGMVSAFLMGLVWCVSEMVGPAGGGLLTKLFVDDAPAKALGVLGILFFVSLVATALLPKLVEEKVLVEI